MKRIELFVCAALCLGVGASAGEVVRVTGAVEVIDPPASVVPPNPEGREEKILLFRERTFVLEPGQTLLGFMPREDVIDAMNDVMGVVIGPDEVLQAHSIACTRPEAGSDRIVGSVTFSQPILICDWGGDSHAFALPGTAYPATHTARMDLPFGFGEQPAGIGDILEFSEDRRTITFSLNGWGENPADHFRVVTRSEDIGVCWQDVLGGLVQGEIRAAALFQGELYVGGEFNRIDGVDADNIARWDGAQWRSVGTGVDRAINALVLHDDGTGEALYAGGSLLSAGGTPAQRIARWDGASWSALAGGGPNLTVHALEVFDDGDGARLYAGGDFTTAGGAVMSQIASWDGGAWRALGSGVDRRVRDMVVYDDGAGAKLYVGGEFELAGGIPSRGVAAWDGDGWSSLAGGVSGGYVLSLGVFGAGGSEELIASGSFNAAQDGASMRRIGAWNGASWRGMGSGLDGVARAILAGTTDGGEPALYVGGQFYEAGGISARNVAQWDGESWAPLEGGVAQQVRALVEEPSSGRLLVLGVVGDQPFLDSVISRWMECDYRCAGDLNQSGLVDFQDLQLVLSSYGQSGEDAAGDADGDGVVGLSDLQLVLHYFGPCPLGCPNGAGSAPDCNRNGLPDDCDIAQGTSFDCDGNGVPDECDVASGLGTDCNENGRLDACDIAIGLSEDCNGNGVPDECEPDCNNNGVPDECDIASGMSQDCDGNGVPDECEVDCNGNGVEDSCDIASGLSEDCNGNGVPDECEPDCNNNGVPDVCDLAAGAQDINGNGVLDICEHIYCPGDITGDARRDASDLNLMLAVFGQESVSYPQADINHDHWINFEDLQILLHFFGEPCP